MIKAKIESVYPNHFIKLKHGIESLYVADYTDQTNSKKGVICQFKVSFNDIECFNIINPTNLDIAWIPFNQKSFKYPNGKPKSQCECVVFPYIGTKETWILFSELKYSQNELSNTSNINKARKQLFKTRYYYYSSGIFQTTNLCYLIIALPKQKEPFANISFTPSYLQNLKLKHSVILRARNGIEIIDDKFLLVDS